MSRGCNLLAIVIGAFVVSISASTCPFSSVYAQSTADARLDAGANCEQNVAGRNEFVNLSATDKAIAQACAEGNHDSDKAWSILLNRGETPSTPPMSETASSTPDALLLILSLIGLALSYVVFRAPSRSVAKMFNHHGSLSTRVVAQAIVALVLRCAIGCAFFCAMAHPLVAAPSAMALLTVIAVTSGASEPRTPSAPYTRPAASTVRLTSSIAADIIDDLLKALPCLVSLALLARPYLSLLVLGLAFALPAATPAMLNARRKLRLAPSAWRACCAILGSAIAGLAVDQLTIDWPSRGPISPPLVGAVLGGIAMTALVRRRALPRRI